MGETAQSDGAPCSSPTKGCTSARGPHIIPDSSLSLKFQMHTKKKILLKMFCFSFPTCFFLCPPLCLKDELSVTFSQSFLLTNLGKVNGSVHAPLCPLSHGISAWQGILVCVKTAIVQFVTHTPRARELVTFKSSTIVLRSPLSLPPFPPCVLSQGRCE